MGICCQPLLAWLRKQAPRPKLATLARKRAWICQPRCCSVSIWVLIHLNVVTLVHLRFGLPYAEVLPLVTPGYVVALVLIALLFRSSWRRSYDRLASEFKA